VAGIPEGGRMSDPVLTADEVALELRISKTQVHRLINGEVPGVPRLPRLVTGRRHLVKRSDLDRWKQLCSTSGEIIPAGSEKNAVTHSKGVH
jgi:hypothetical protein